MTSVADQMESAPTDMRQAKRTGRRIVIRVLPFDKIELSTDPAFIVKGLVPREGLTVIWGPPKCGKSFVTFDMVMHVALGWEYRGRRVVRGPVVYVACEGATGLRATVAQSESYRRLREAEFERLLDLLWGCNESQRRFLIAVAYYLRRSGQFEITRDQAGLWIAVADVIGVNPSVIIQKDGQHWLCRQMPGCDVDLNRLIRLSDHSMRYVVDELVKIGRVHVESAGVC